MPISATPRAQSIASTRPPVFGGPSACAVPALTTRLRTARRRGCARPRIRPGRSSAHGRRAARHSMTSSPPGRRTIPLRSMRLRREAATSVAQAAEPQASVRPTPRSQTRAMTRSRAATSAKVTLAFCVNIGWTSIRAPQAAASTTARSATKKTACGLPRLTTEAGPSAESASPSGQSRSTRLVSATGRTSGMASHANFGAPMSTR